MGPRVRGDDALCLPIQFSNSQGHEPAFPRRDAPGFCVFFHPEGAGNAGRPMRPIAACAEIVVERTRVSQVTPEIARHSPRNGFNGFLRALPGDRAFLSPSPAKVVFHELDASVGASGPHDFSVRFRRARLAAPSASTASRPAFVTLRNAPPKGRDGTDIAVIWVSEKQKYFCKRGWTGFSDLPVGQIRLNVKGNFFSIVIPERAQREPGIQGFPDAQLRI